MRNAYIESLYELTQTNRRVYSLVADNGAIVFDKYREAFPENFVNVGIAESTMVSVAAGMASCGDLPYLYTIIPFLIMRAYEQIRNDVCMQKMNVKFVGIGAGYRYSTLGPTHHAIEDLALMRALPNMTVVSPADPLEAQKVIKASVNYEGPMYIRLGTSKEPSVYEKDYDFKLGKASLLKQGNDLAIIATGNAVYNSLQAVNQLEEKGVNVRLINMHTIKPLDYDVILSAASETKTILVIENHSVIGGLTSAVAEVLAANNCRCFFDRIAIEDQFCSEYGTYEELNEKYGFSVKNIINKVKSLLAS